MLFFIIVDMRETKSSMLGSRCVLCNSKDYEYEDATGQTSADKSDHLRQISHDI